MLSQQDTSLLYGKPLVKPGSIEGELDKVRNAAADTDAQKEKSAKGTASPRAKATLSNLIILNAGKGEKSIVASIDHLINELCLAHPSRFFIVDCELPANSVPSGIATAVSSRCFLAESGAHVCSEEIYVSVEKKAVQFVGNLLVSLLAPDVDVMLIVLGDPSPQREEPDSPFVQLFSALLKISDRVIYDSARCESYSKGIRALTGAVEKITPQAGAFAQTAQKLGDMNWRRIKRWRALIAEGFDAERFSASSPVVTGVSIGCHFAPEDLRRGHVPAEGLLLAGWMLSNLSAAPDKSTLKATDSGLTIDCKGRRGIVQLEFLNRNAQHEVAAEVESVTIMADAPEYQAQLAVVRRADQNNSEISTGITEKSGANKSSCEFTVRNAPFLSDGLDQLVLSNVVSRRDDEQYFAALELSLSLSELLAGGNGR